MPTRNSHNPQLSDSRPLGGGTGRREFVKAAFASLALPPLLRKRAPGSPLGIRDRAPGLEVERVIGTMDGDPHYVFGRIESAVADGEGRYHIGDAMAETDLVSVFDPTGTYLFGYGRRGEGPGEFRSAQKMQVAPSGDIYIQSKLGMVLRFSQEGKFLEQHEFATSMNWVKHFCVLKDGSLAVLGITRDEYSTRQVPEHVFRIFGMDGTLRGSFGRWPAVEAVDAVARQEDFNGFDLWDIRSMEITYDARSDRIYAVNPVLPNIVYAYQVGEDSPHVMSTDRSLSGKISVGPSTGERATTQGAYDGKSGDSVWVYADQYVAKTSHLCQAGGTVFMQVRDNLAKAETVRGYAIESGARILNAPRALGDPIPPRVIQNRKIAGNFGRGNLTLLASAGGPRLLSAQSDPFPALVVERVTK